MDLQQSEFDRLLFFEHARKTAEAAYAANPLDVDVSFSFSKFSLHFEKTPQISVILPIYLFIYICLFVGLGQCSEYKSFIA